MRGYHHETGNLQFVSTGTTDMLAQYSAYSFDALNNLTKRIWWGNNTFRSESFSYDNLNRLTSGV